MSRWERARAAWHDPSPIQLAWQYAMTGSLAGAAIAVTLALVAYWLGLFPIA